MGLLNKFRDYLISVGYTPWFQRPIPRFNWAHEIICKHIAHDLFPYPFNASLVLIQLNMLSGVGGSPILWNMRHVKMSRDSWLANLHGEWWLINDWCLISGDEAIDFGKFLHLFLQKRHLVKDFLRYFLVSRGIFPFLEKHLRINGMFTNWEWEWE